MLKPSTRFVSGLHIDAVCEHLQAMMEGRIKDLIICYPRNAKSRLASLRELGTPDLKGAVDTPAGS